MEETKIEIAIDIMQRKIAHFIKNNKEKDKEVFKQQLQRLVEEEDKIYELDEGIIEKVYQVYLKEVKGEKK